MPRALLATMLAATLMASGCSKETNAAPKPGDEPDGCTAFWERVDRCMPDLAEGVEQSGFVSMCRMIASEKGADSLMTHQLKCAEQHTGCGAFQACADQAKTDFEARKVAGVVTAVTAAIDRLDFGEAGRLCRGDTKPGNLQAECRRATELEWAQVKMELTIVRDGAEAQGLVKCMRLKTLGRRLSGAARAEADILCKETKLALKIKRALQAARNNIGSGRPYIPSSCDAGIRELDKMASGWSGRRKEALRTMCYVKLGAVVLRAMASDAKPRCNANVRRVIKVMDAHPINDLDLDRLIDVGRTACRM